MTTNNTSAEATIDVARSSGYLEELTSRLMARVKQDDDLRRILELAGHWLLEVSAAAHESVADKDSADANTEFASADHNREQVASPQVEPKSILPGSKVESFEPVDQRMLADLLSRFESPTVSPLLPARSRPAEPASTRPHARRSVSDMGMLHRRMELKADACAWAIRRFDEALAGNGFEPCKAEYEQLRARADTMQPCYLWMIHSDTAFIPREDWLRLEICYRACAEVLRLIGAFPEEYERSLELLKVLGETQSSIRAAMASCGAFPDWTDADQQTVFQWCRDEGDDRRVFNPYLNLDSLADPSLAATLLARARQLGTDLTAQRDTKRQIRSSLNTIRYHLGQLHDSDQNSEHHWARIAEGVQGALDAGAPASMPDLVDSLLPVADELPDYLLDQRGLQNVLQYVDQRVAAEQMSHQPPAPARETTAEVLQVRKALRGTRVVLIGGNIRSHSKALLEREFELAELDWQDSREHQSITPFDAPIARQDTKLVILMIRWASHSFEGVQEMCLKHGKPFVRLPGGYNAAQVAHQILNQVSEQLGLVEASPRPPAIG